MDTIKEYWRQWLWRDAVNRLITVNFVVWITAALCELFGINLAGILSLPHKVMQSPIGVLSIFTYMFDHADFMHMLVNMLWLLLFGGVFMQSQSGARLVAIYILGGIAGAVSFLLFHEHGSMVGASCSVLAVVGASAALQPKWRVNLFIFGAVQVIWIAVAAVVIFIIMESGTDIMVAHTAGLAVGVVYVLLKRQHIDITRLALWLMGLAERRKVYRPQAPSHRPDKSEEEEFDYLLEKIGRSGYGSLTPNERQRLFNLSQKIKR